MNNKPIDIAPYLNESTRNDPEVQSKLRYNNGGGDDNMNKNPYVTHQELDLTTEKILHHMDNRFAEMDKRFAEVNLNISEAKNIAKSADSKANWILGILAGVIIAAITALFHFN